jgi:GNAT superfamily N-acetyltransferase
VELRRASQSDADGIADVFIAALAGMSYLPRLHSDEETRGWIRSAVLAEDEVWVAEEKGRVVGFAALAEGWLEHLYVAPDRQGRGIGTALFNLVTVCLPAGFRLWIFQRNEGARRFYERRGCSVVELTDGSGNEYREPDALLEWRPSV